MNCRALIPNENHGAARGIEVHPTMLGASLLILNASYRLSRRPMREPEPTDRRHAGEAHNAGLIDANMQATRGGIEGTRRYPARCG